MVSRNSNSFNHRLTFKSFINPVPNWTKFSYILPNCNLKRRSKTQNTDNLQINQASLGFHIPLIASNNITIKSHIYKNRNTNYRPVCLSISSMLVWNTWSTASTLTPVPLCGIANTSTTRTVYSSTNSPSINPITSMGTPALPISLTIIHNY